MLGAGAPPVFPPAAPGAEGSLALTAQAIGLIVIMAALALWATRRLPTEAQDREQAAEREYAQAA
jgi:hypothetical protein